MRRFQTSDINANSIQGGQYQDLLPELYALRGVIENNLGHCRQDVFEHTLKVLISLEKILDQRYLGSAKQKVGYCLSQKVSRLTRREILVLAVLFHDLGKKDTLFFQNQQSTCPAHEIFSCFKLDAIQKRLGLAAGDYKLLRQLVFYHDLAWDFSSLIIFKVHKGAWDIFRKLVDPYFMEQMLLLWADLVGGNSDNTDRSLYNKRAKLIQRTILDQLNKI